MKVKVNDQPEMPSDLRRFFQQWLERERDTEDASPTQRPTGLNKDLAALAIIPYDCKVLYRAIPWHS